jgi:GTPase SAR1 family protein
LQLWDIGSQVKSLQMAANYLQGCDAVVIVHDLTNKEVRQEASQQV